MKLKKLTSIAAMTAVAAIAQTVVVASLYGVDQEVESFFIAVTLLSTFVQFTLSGRIGELFIPVYHQLQQERGLLTARRANTLLLFGTVTIGSALVLCAILLSTPLAALLGPGLAPERQTHLAQMLRVLIPCLVLQLLNANLATLAIAERQFLFPEIARLVGRLVNIATIIVSYSVLHEWSLVVGYWVSTLSSIIVSGAGCWKAGYRFNWPSLWEHRFLAPVMRAAPASIASISAQQLYAIALNATLTYCPPGTVAIYNYCLRMITRLTGIIIRPAAIVFHSNFSKQIAGHSASRKTVEAATGAVLANTCVCVVAVWASLPNSIYFLFGVNKLSDVDIQFMSILLATFMATYFAKGPGTIARKTAVSLGRGGLAYKFEAVTNMVCLVIACLLIYFFQRSGLVQALVISAVSRAAMAYFPLRGRADLMVVYQLGSFLKWIVPLIASLVFCILMRHVLSDWVVHDRLLHGIKAGTVAFTCVLFLIALRLAISSSYFKRVFQQLSARGNA